MFGSRDLDWARDGANWPLREASRFVRAAGLRWHVQVAGEGPALLLIHGVGGATHSWRGMIPLLADRFTLVAPDLPGHGFTTMPRRQAMTLPNMASGLATLCEAIGASPVGLVGHSAGAAIAARMALDGTADPRAIVSFNGAFVPFRGLAGRTFPQIARALTLNPLVPRAVAWSAATDRAAAGRLLKMIGSEIDAEGRRLYEALFKAPRHVDAALSMMACWNLAPLMGDLRRLTPPLALAFGETDRAVPPGDAVEIAALAPHARLIEMPGLGHLAHEEDPALAARIVSETMVEAGARPPSASA